MSESTPTTAPNPRKAEGFISASEVKAWAAGKGITEGYGTRGRVAVSLRRDYLLRNPKAARAHAAVVGVTLSNAKGSLKAADLDALAPTVGG